MGVINDLHRAPVLKTSSKSGLSSPNSLDYRVHYDTPAYAFTLLYIKRFGTVFPVQLL